MKTLTLMDLEKYHLKKIVYDFSVEYSAIDKTEILNIHKNLTVENNIKYCLDLL